MTELYWERHCFRKCCPLPTHRLQGPVHSKELTIISITELGEQSSITGPPIHATGRREQGPRFYGPSPSHLDWKNALLPCPILENSQTW